jgi:O-acetylhomoserine (thiol)-lyase
VPGTDPADYAAAVRPETKAIYAEVVANPSGEVTDIAGLAEVAHAIGSPW